MGGACRRAASGPVTQSSWWAAFAGGAGSNTLLPNSGGVGHQGAAVEEVQLPTEVVEGEANNVEEVAVHRLHQHAAQGLDAVAARLVPEANATN